jgi:hypothetical protein
MMDRLMGSERAAMVRAADDQRRMVRSENPAHLGQIRPARPPGADRADQKTKTLLTAHLA